MENRQKEGLEVSRREMLILSNCMACNIAYRIEKARFRRHLPWIGILNTS
ncbi:MAG: hypothetical protein WAW22_08735 [Smithellaceae bacterium]